MNVLVIDVGGTHVKFVASGGKEHRRFVSGPALKPRAMVREIKRLTEDWSYDGIAMGYPGLVVNDRIGAEPRNLGRGWVDVDFAALFACPVKIINDAAMQALGNYRGGRMLFLGLGTGLGAAMIVDGHVEAMELAHLPYRKGHSYEDYLGAAGLERHGRPKWRKHVAKVIALFRAAFAAEDVVAGGGNATLLRRLADGVRIGNNSKAFAGGFRLWEASSKRVSERRSARAR